MGEVHADDIETCGTELVKGFDGVGLRTDRANDGGTAVVLGRLEFCATQVGGLADRSKRCTTSYTWEDAPADVLRRESALYMRLLQRIIVEAGLLT